MKPFISAIIVAYRSDKYINPCIASIITSARFAQLPLEVIVVINDPKNISYRLPKIAKVIKSKKNIGYAAGVNAGAKRARGEWLLVANPDTVTDEKALLYMSQHFNDKNVAVVGPKIFLLDGSIQLTINKLPSLWQVFLEQSYLYKIFPFSKLTPKADMRQYAYTHEVEALEGTYLLIQKKYFDLLGGMDERFFLYYEDMDFCKKINGVNFRILFEPRAIIIHKQHRSSQGYIVGKYYVRSLRLYIKKYSNFVYTFIFMTIFYCGSLLRLLGWSILRYILGKSSTNETKITTYTSYLRK